MSAGWALSWELWARQRWLLRITGVYLLLVFLLAATLPAVERPQMLWWMLAPLVGVLVLVVAGLSRGQDGKYEQPGSLLPDRLLVLPVSSRALVGWSMLAGALPVSLLWPIFALGLYWLQGEALPLVWPTLLVFNVVAWLQALSFLPFGVPYLRLWLTGLGVPGLIMATCGAGAEDVPEWVLAGLLIGLGLAAFHLAVAGVEQARQGAGLSWAGFWPHAISAARRSSKPFASPLQALCWMEWRLTAWRFLFGAGIALICLLPLLYLASRALEQTQLVEEVGLAPAVEAVGQGWLALAGLVWVPFLFGVIGWDAGSADPATYGQSLSFGLVRPVSTAILVAAKLWVCAYGTLLCGLLVIPTVLGWALPTGHWLEMSDRLVALSGSGWAAMLIFVGGLLSLFAMTWGQMAAGLWVGLSGRMWVLKVMLIGFIGLAILVAYLATESARRSEVARQLPSILAWAVACKAVLTLVVSVENIRRELLALRTVLLALGAWLAVAVLLFAELAWLVPVDKVTRANLALGVALVLPIARIGLAPLALAWNRHR